MEARYISRYKMGDKLMKNTIIQCILLILTISMILLILWLRGDIP